MPVRFFGEIYRGIPRMIYLEMFEGVLIVFMEEYLEHFIYELLDKLTELSLEKFLSDFLELQIFF